MLDRHTALIHTMVLVSAADREMSDRELALIGRHVQTLPIFEGFDVERLPKVAASCAKALTAANGLDRELAAIADALPTRLKETAFTLACDIAAADGAAGLEVLRLLELMQDAFGLDDLAATAIKRAARARYARA